MHILCKTTSKHANRRQIENTHTQYICGAKCISHKTHSPRSHYNENGNAFEKERVLTNTNSLHLPATTVSARCNRIKTCSINPTSVHACKLRTLLRKIAMNTLHISA